jgi:hypothetical protein
MLRSGHLNDDWGYVKTMENQSMFPYRYLTRFAPWQGCPISNCNKQFRTGPMQINTWNTLAESMPTRILEKGSRINTELFGTAPFRARGDGHLFAPDVSNALMRNSETSVRCARPLAETELPRFDYIAFPNQAEWWRRGGESSRLGPVYVQPVAFM